MSLTYYYSFCAPAETESTELETFLKSVESEAKTLGFQPTTVLNVRFTSPEQRSFSRQLGGSRVIEDDRLKGKPGLREDQVWHHHPDSGTVRLVPWRAVVLVITDEHGRETCMGFMKYPTEILDANGATIMETPFRDRWLFKDFVNSPDPRYRKLVQHFRLAGYLESEVDEFKSKPDTP